MVLTSKRSARKREDDRVTHGDFFSGDFVLCGRIETLAQPNEYIRKMKLGTSKATGL